jgi:hypothetical protein
MILVVIWDVFRTGTAKNRLLIAEKITIQQNLICQLIVVAVVDVFSAGTI